MNNLDDVDKKSHIKKSIVELKYYVQYFYW